MYCGSQTKYFGRSKPSSCPLKHYDQPKMLFFFLHILGTFLDHIICQKYIFGKNILIVYCRSQTKHYDRLKPISCPLNHFKQLKDTVSGHFRPFFGPKRHFRHFFGSHNMSKTYFLVKIL